MHKKTQIRVHFGLKFSAKSWPHLTMELVCVVHVSIYKEKNYPKIFFQRESCRSSATYDLWLKAESWILKFKNFNLRFKEII